MLVLFWIVIFVKLTAGPPLINVVKHPNMYRSGPATKPEATPMPTPVLSPKLITAEASIFNCGAQTVNTLKAVGILTGVNAKLGYGTGVGVGIGVKQTSGKAKLTPNILVIANTITSP
jgi:hypothetical protein